MEWDQFLTHQDRSVIEASGYGSRGGLGASPALLVVDVTYAFCGDRPEPILASIGRFRNSSGQAAWAAIASIRPLLVAARERGLPVIYTGGIATQRSDTGRWASKNLRAGDEAEDDFAIVADIAPVAGEPVLRKLKPSAFFGTPLTSLLIDRGVDSLIVCGGTTSGCVRATVVDAFSLNYPVAVVKEATFDRIVASHWVSLLDMDLKYADVMTLAETIEALPD